jgi:hypothetical protein
MKFAPLVVSALLLISPSIAFSQTTSDETRVIEAALDRSFNHSFPYVKKWVVSQLTEPLPLGDAPSPNIERARTDYTARNTESLSLTSLQLPKKATTADISLFTQSEGFNWAAFEERFGAETWTARVSRPGFADASNAVVRIDVWAREKRVPPATTVVFLTKQDNGGWHATGGMLPAVKNSDPAKALN